MKEISYLYYLTKRVLQLCLLFSLIFLIFLQLDLIKPIEFFGFKFDLFFNIKEQVLFLWKFHINKILVLFFSKPTPKKVVLSLEIILICYLCLIFYRDYQSRKVKVPNSFKYIKNIHDIRNNLNPTSFEHFVAYLFRKLGYNSARRVGFGENVKKSKKDGIFGDGGKDVIISRPFRKDILIQCKFYSQPIGVQIVREMFGVLHHYKASKVIIVTTSFFSRDAVKFAEGKPIELIDANKLDALTQQIYYR